LTKRFAMDRTELLLLLLLLPVISADRRMAEHSSAKPAHTCHAGGKQVVQVFALGRE
jgi:hypothetical protein